MSDQNEPFQRSARTLRSPPQRQDDSTIVDPNASSCLLCLRKDTAEMVECDKRRNWYHFQCVGVDSSITSVDWNCQNCTTQVIPNVLNCPICNEEDSVLMLQCNKCKTLFHSCCVGVDSSVDTSAWNCQKCTTKLANVERKSVRSSTSSKRHSVLLLEKLEKEKAIQDKLIEEKKKLAQQQAAIDTEFLQKEFTIRENMTDSDDEGAVGGENTEKTGFVTDWLKTVDITKSSSSTKDLLMNLGATREQIFELTRDKIMSAVTPAPEDFVLIPPKHVQFAQPLTSDTMNTSTGNTTPAVDNTKNPSGTSYHHQPMNPSENGSNLRSLISQYEQLGNVTSTNPTLSQMNQSLPMYTSTAGQMNSGTLPFAPNNSYQPSSMVPHSARSSITVKQSVQSQVYTPVSHQSTLSATSVQQSSTPISYQQLVVPNVIQQPLVCISNQQQPFGSIPVQQFIPNSQQATIPTSNMQSQQFTSNSYQQRQSVPVVSIYQQPIVTSQHQQFVPSSVQYPMFGSNAISMTSPFPGSNFGLNSSVFGLPPQITVNQGTTYDPRLNSYHQVAYNWQQGKRCRKIIPSLMETRNDGRYL